MGMERLRAVAMLVMVFVAITAFGFEELLPATLGEPGDFAPRRAGVEVNASIKIGVVAEGMYKLTYANLTNAGVSAASMVGDQMRLFYRTQEVAIAVSAGGVWSANDYLLFYGVPFDGSHTLTNIYWLGFGSGGLRMTTVDATPQTGVAVTTCTARVTHSPRRKYIDKGWFSEEFDHWFVTNVTDTVTNLFSVATPALAGGGTATVEVVMYGFTEDYGVDPDHKTVVQFNGVDRLWSLYDGQDRSVFATNMPVSQLQSNNAVGLRQVLLPGVASDLAYLRSVSITYPRLLTASTHLLFAAESSVSNIYLVRGFATNSLLWALDVSEAARPKVLTGGVVTNVAVGEWALRFAAGSTNAGRYGVGLASAYLDVVSVERVAWRGLAATNRQTDYIVVCSETLRRPLYRLLKYRYRQGLSVCVAPVDAIYNEFGYGVTDPAAIKQFLGFAFHHWQGPPAQYVILAGTGSYDPRNYLGYNAPELVPVHMGRTSYKWTALDGWYVQVNGLDNVPDMGLGRIPLENETYVSNLVDKIVAFESATSTTARARTLLAADEYDSLTGYDFKAASESLRNNCMVTNGMYTNTTAYLGDKTPEDARKTVTNAINAGVLSGGYIGHGALNLWSTSLLDTNDVYGLKNTFYPIMVMLTCDNGAFQSPTSLKSMTEAFLERAGRGASGCLAAAALTTDIASEKIGKGFYGGIYGDRWHRVGAAVAAGYASLFNYADTNAPELSYVVYFGDPAMVVNP